MDFFHKLLLSFAKAILNTTLSFLFGILQIGVVYLLTELSEKDFDLREFYNTGFFLFFTVAIVSSVLVEYYIDAKIKTNVYFDAFIILACFILSMFCMVVFSKIFLEIDTTDTALSVLIQNISIGFAIAVSILLKVILNFKRL